LLLKNVDFYTNYSNKFADVIFFAYLCTVFCVHVIDYGYFDYEQYLKNNDKK